MTCLATKKDGSPCKGKARESGLCVFHEKNSPAAAPLETPTGVVLGGPPTKLKGLRRQRNPRVGLRAITMLRAICDECQDGENVPWDWYKSCTHEPYVGNRQKIREVPVYSAPAEDGSVTLERMEERITWEVWPHFVDVIDDGRVDSGNRVAKMQARGWILPTDLRTPAFPNGIAPMCEFNRCRWQEGLKQYRRGVFCREIEARLVEANATDTNGDRLHEALEVWRPGKREAQLQAVAI